MVARLFDGCGVLPSGIITSHITSTPLVRPPSGNTATGLSTQSDECPSACKVEEPSNPHSGSCSRVGNESNSLIWVLPRRFGVGIYPSSQMYSSLYLVITGLSLADDEDVWSCPPPTAPGRQPLSASRSTNYANP